jgi:transcriptional regulator with GAF, ATPase, and Fis domain
MILDRRNLKKQIEAIEKRAITAALEDCGWVMARAARRLGITERMIAYRIKKYGIRKEGTGSDALKDIQDRTT